MCTPQTQYTGADEESTADVVMSKTSEMWKALQMEHGAKQVRHAVQMLG